MTMRLALGSADIVGPGGDTLHRQVIVDTRDGRLRIRSRQGETLIDTEVTAVAPVAGERGVQRFTLDTPEFGVLTAERKGGCGCGG